MKTNAIIRIILWSAVIVILAGILVTALAGGALYTVKRTEHTVHSPIQSDALQFPAGDFSKLEIQWAAGDIRVVPKAGIDVIEVSESSSGSKYGMYCKTSGRKLTIQYSKDSIFDFGINFGAEVSKDLYIFVPENWICDEMQIEVAAADVDVQNMTIHTLDFDGASGTCNFVNCILGDLDIDTASGDVTFTGELDILDFDAASASFRGTLNNCPREIDMDGVSGDLDLTLPEDCGFTLNMDGLSSNLRCEFEYSLRGDGTYVSGDGSCRIDVDGMSSDVYIRRCDASSVTPPEVSTAPTANGGPSPVHHEHSDACTTDPDSCPDSTVHHTEH